ncbi:MAG TPA: M28 family peptidase, partial [Parvularculaceae bacterium]|nr:M28 family peptidase [Parvularculaceae bacterium]
MDASPRRSDLRLVLLLAAILGALALTGFALSLPKVEPAPRPGEFDTNDALALLSRVLGDERPHSVDTLANDAVRERLLAEIRAMGYAPEVRDDFSCRAMAKYSMTACARVRNIVFRAGPQDGEAVMLAAHYDSVPAGPGGADDGLGVSVELEIAKIFSKAPPTKPLLFLVTDGEEMGLLGAHSFVRNDPLAGDIAAVVNIEARGDKGPAVMFQTSAPNSADIAAFAKGAGRPFSNSMMTDIYRLLPNDTDVTEFLPKGYDALNIALGDGLSHYHTPHDTIANLDPRSVQHTGRQALGAIRALLNAPAKGAEHEVVFTDILSRFLLTAPQWLAGVVLLVGLGAAAFSFLQGGGARP